MSVACSESVDQTALRRSRAPRNVCGLFLLTLLCLGCGSRPQPSFHNKPVPQLSTEYANFPLSVGRVDARDDAERNHARDGVKLANVVLRSSCFKQAVAAARFANTGGDSNDDVYRKMTSGVATPFTVSFYTGDLISNYGWRTVGYETENDRTTVHMNRHFVHDAFWVASNLLHEAAHTFEYRHKSARQHDSVPYAMNAIFDRCWQDAIDDSKDSGLIAGKALLLASSKQNLLLEVGAGGLLKIDHVPVVATNDAGIISRVCTSRVALAGELTTLMKVRGSREEPDIPQSLLSTLEPASEACKKLAANRTDLSAADLAALQAVVDASTGGNLAALRASSKLGERPAFAALEQDIAAQVAQPTQANLGNLEAQIIAGIADLAVTRAKAEAIDYLRTKLTRDLCTPESASYLASTCVALKELDPTLSIAAAGSYLQAAAFRDLGRLPELLLTRIDARQRTDEQQALLLGLVFYREARAGRQPLELAWGIRRMTCPKQRAGQVWLGSRDGSACLAAELMTAIVTTRDAATRTDPNTKAAVMTRFKTLIESDWNGLTLERTELALLSARLDDIIDAVAAVERDARAMVSASSKPSAAERFSLASRAFAAFLDASRATACIKQGPRDGDCAPTGLETSRDVSDLGSNLFASDMGGSMAKVISLLADVSVTPPKSIRTTIPVLTELASAKSSKDVVTTLEAAAAPVGSYKAKYERPGAAVNILLGASGGAEWVKSDVVAATGFYAPVGVHAWSPLVPHAAAHLGLFASVIDVGALTQVRLVEKDGVEQTPTVGFAQVFSPGLFATLGLARTPLLLGLGASATPELRAKGEKDLPAVRVGGFVAFDIPVFPF